MLYGKRGGENTSGAEDFSRLIGMWRYCSRILPLAVLTSFQWWQQRNLTFSFSRKWCVSGEWPWLSANFIPASDALPDISWGEASVGSYHAVMMTSWDTVSGTTPTRYTLTPPDPSPLYHFPISTASLSRALSRVPFPKLALCYSFLISCSPSHLVVILFVSVSSSISSTSFIQPACLFPLFLSHLFNVFGNGCLSEHILSLFQQLSSMSPLCFTAHLTLGPSWTLVFQTHHPQ